MNKAHVISASALTAALAGVLIWLSHWPLQPLDRGTAVDLASIVVALGIVVFARFSGGVSAVEKAVQEVKAEPVVAKTVTDTPKAVAEPAAPAAPAPPAA